MAEVKVYLELSRQCLKRTPLTDRKISTVPHERRLSQCFFRFSKSIYTTILVVKLVRLSRSAPNEMDHLSANANIHHYRNTRS